MKLRVAKKVWRSRRGIGWQARRLRTWRRALILLARRDRRVSR